MTAIVEGTLSREELIHLHNIGFKLVPLGEDCKTPTIKSTNEVYYNPNYWAAQRITLEAFKFKNVATIFGKSHIKDYDGRDLFLNEIDIDSKEVFDRLAVVKEHFFIDDMCKLTYVVFTKKKWGRRIYWLSHKQYPPIGTRDCKPGFEFEIKTDNTLGHSTLPPSRHRDDSNFHYRSMGQETIAIQDNLYDGILKELSDCLRNNKPADTDVSNTLRPSVGTNVNVILTDNEIEEDIFQLKDYYQKGSRQNLMLGLSGLLYKSGIALESAEKLLDYLCHSTNDEEKRSRITCLHITYTKGKNGEMIVGSSLLLEVLNRFVDPDLAKSILQNITRVWSKYKNPVLMQLQDHIRQELQQHVVEFLCYTPLVFAIAHSHKKQILYGRIESRHVAENHEGK